MNRGRSIFVGKKVSLVEGHQTLLYPRYHAEKETRCDATSPTQRRHVALGLPPDFSRDKKRKIRDFVALPHTPEQKKDTSHQNAEGNAEEAHRMREIMGFQKGQDPSNPRFAFNFDAGSEVRSPLQEKAWSVFVGGMPYTWSAEEVIEFWSECGEVAEVECMTFHDTGRFKGIAKITYKTEEGYRAALSCDGDCWEEFYFVVTPWQAKEKASSLPAKNVASRRVEASQAPIGEKTEGFDVLFMCHLPLTWTADNVAELFDEFEIEAVKLKTDPQTGRSKGYAHIHFGQADRRLEEAIEKLDQTEIEGRTVRLGYAIPPPNWKPKTRNAKKRALHVKDSDLGAEDFKTMDGRFLVRLSGLQPSATESEIRRFFDDVSLLDIVFLWSVRNQRNSGAVYLLIPDQANLERLWVRNRQFYQGRRLHARPGKFSDYLQKTTRSRKSSKRRQPSASAVHQNDEDDPLMCLL